MGSRLVLGDEVGHRVRGRAEPVAPSRDGGDGGEDPFDQMVLDILEHATEAILQVGEMAFESGVVDIGALEQHLDRRPPEALLEAEGNERLRHALTLARRRRALALVHGSLTGWLGAWSSSEAAFSPR
jgi:hypothetical protein